MSISDPARILTRVPELQELIFDAKIRHAIETGDPFRIYRALMLARLLRRLPKHRELLKTLTRERRLFARPLKGTPGLGTLNSVGLSFVGQAERDDENYHIALHAFVVLFAIPIIPLGAYLVKSTGERQWQIFARVPLGMAGWLYTRGLALSLVLLVLAGAGQSWHEYGEHDLLVLNGFPAPAQLNLAGKQVSVPANGMATFRFKTGPMNGSASLAGAGVVDQFNQNLRFGTQTSIWNIAGAAPLLKADVIYYRQVGNQPEPEPKPTIYCGQRFIEFDKVDYMLTDPPQKLSMGKHDTRRVVSHVRLYHDPKDAKRSGADICGSHLFGSDEEKNIAATLEAMAVLQKWDMRATTYAILSARALSPAEAARVAKRAAQAKPELEYFRAWRSVAEDADQHASLVPEFAALARAQPDNPDLQYLNATLLSGQAAMDALQEVVNRFPKHARSLSSLAWHQLARADYQGAQKHLQRLHQLAPDEARNMIDVEVQILLALHQGKQALQLLKTSLNTQENAQENAQDKHGHARHAVDFALLARQLGQADPEQWIRQVDKDETSRRQLDVQRARASLPVPHTPTADAQPLIDLSLALGNDPAKALKIAQSIPALNLRELAPDQVALLLCEALRARNTVMAQRARELSALLQPDFVRLRDYVNGAAVTLSDSDVNPEIQAAAHLSRSRQPNLAPAERDRLRNLAAQLDFLHGNIHIALEKWTQP